MYACWRFPEIEALCETSFFDPAASNSPSHAMAARPDAIRAAITEQFIVGDRQPRRSAVKTKLHGQWNLCE